MPPSVTVVIPAFQEGKNLTDLVSSFASQDGVQVIVSLPEGDDVSRSALGGLAPTVVTGPAGRGRQVAAGAEKATGEHILICHADTRLPQGWRDEVQRVLSLPGVAAGAFALSFNDASPAMKMVAFFGNLRARWFSLPYGDQAVFTTSENYRACGGVRPLELMEDVDYVKRLSALGRIVISPLPVATSARRYRRRGVAWSVLRNALLIALYHLGVSTARLARWYR